MKKMNYKRLFLIILLGITIWFLSACGESQNAPLIVEKPVVVELDENIFQCDRVKITENIDRLTDSEVAMIITRYDRENRRCFRTINNIKMSLEEAKEILEKENGA